MTSKSVVGVILWAAVAAHLAACEGGGSTSVSGTTGRLDITIKAKDRLRFEPNLIDAKVGQTVTVVLDNVSHSEHTFTIDALEVDSGPIGEGQQTLLSFAADKPGRYTFYSAMPGERTGGMVGTLNVVE